MPPRTVCAGDEGQDQVAAASAPSGRTRHKWRRRARTSRRPGAPPAEAESWIRRGGLASPRATSGSRGPGAAVSPPLGQPCGSGTSTSLPLFDKRSRLSLAVFTVAGVESGSDGTAGADNRSRRGGVARRPRPGVTPPGAPSDANGPSSARLTSPPRYAGRASLSGLCRRAEPLDAVRRWAELYGSAPARTDQSASPGLTGPGGRAPPVGAAAFGARRARPLRILRRRARGGGPSAPLGRRGCALG